MHFKYGLLDLWEFFCELLEINEEKPAVNYPITVFRFGNVPLKAPGKSGGSSLSKKSNLAVFDDNFILPEEDFSSEFDDDNYDDEDDFGSDYADDYDDEDLNNL